VIANNVLKVFKNKR